MCDIKGKILCENDNCKSCFNKSFKSVIPNNLSILDNEINPRLNK